MAPPEVPGTPSGSTAPRLIGSAVISLVVLALGLGCTEARVIGEGQFSRPIALASDPGAPLPRLAWLPGEACPGPLGGCSSFCVGAPDSCDPSACRPLLIDSGTPLSILPSRDGTLGFGKECVELRAAGGLLDDPIETVLEASTASFRLYEAPIVRAPGTEVAGWEWEAGDDLDPIAAGGVIGGNILRDFALELRHLEGETPSVAFFSEFPGTETVLADQGRAYLRLQYPGRLLGRLRNDSCELAPGLDCRLSGFNFNQDNQDLLFESTRALVDACVAPPPCAVKWTQANGCQLRSGGLDSSACPADPTELGGSATLLVATGVPGLVLFEDSAARLLGALDQLPSCDTLAPESSAPACTQAEPGRLVLPGWPALDQLQRLRVRSLGIVQGLDQSSGPAPCQRLRDRLNGLVRQCKGFAAEGRPVRPSAKSGSSIAGSALVIGEVMLGDDQLGPDTSAWLSALIVPATAAPVLALRREIVPEGAQPDGLIGGALLRNTETVLDFTEPVESPGVRVRCLDPGGRCLAAPACEPEGGGVEFPDADPGRTSCCFGLPSNLIARVVLEGEQKQAPRVEDACCSALPRAALADLQSPALDLCTDVDAF
ncbi:hypothetical protein [Enhygromyxa salina]|uniref:Uncharacterized protein n=1 Tax=Enhygromyxa salina TaxID=215803 RepID=A0A2S9YQF3_9BACT|nr:hypothetical protein [Enhygromyxa salina]PRQ07289.1 hypothetical protein ENSA7_29980 [Enhygromyxa salina]